MSGSDLQHRGSSASGQKFWMAGAVMLVAVLSSCGGAKRPAMEHEMRAPRCDRIKPAEEALDDTILAAVAALHLEGYPVHGVNTETNTVYSEYSYPRKVVIQLTIEVKGPAEAVVSAEHTGLSYDERIWLRANALTLRVANITSDLYCLPRDELVERAAEAGVEYPFKDQR